jgi:2-polyprenyl-3-methyl-5-hydroxy-6-metoxy-1,4-benzoquinol methylase
MTEDPERPTAAYRPEVYEVKSLKQAMAVILTPEPGTTTEDRWEKETPYVVDDIDAFLAIQPDTCVLDYGCGVGRVAKALIERFGCRVIGVDASQSMRQMAPEYVLSDRFTVWSPEVMEKMIDKGFRVDCCVCLWVLQHVFDLRKVIDQIAKILPEGALLYTMNQKVRCVPSSLGYVNDGLDVRSELCRVFSEENLHSPPASETSAHLESITLIQVLRNRASQAHRPAIE